MATRTQHATEKLNDINDPCQPSKLRVAGSNPAGVATAYFAPFVSKTWLAVGRRFHRTTDSHDLRTGAAGIMSAL